MHNQILRRVLVPAERAGDRLDVVATALVGDYSREQIKRWIRDGVLTVDGEPMSASDHVRGGETLLLQTTLTAREDWQTPQEVRFDLIYQDSGLLVINKPAGVVVHPGAGARDGTLVNGLLARFPELAVVPRAGIVHRLDKDTSGLMLIARTLPMHTHLVRMIAGRAVGRRYLALVHGVPDTDFEVDAPIGRHPRARTNMAVIANGRPAHTRFRRLAHAHNISLLEAQLTTGRTHQIRVHLSHIGFPIVGDPRYGKPAAASAANSEVLGRQALHAWRLAARHPQTGVSLVWRAGPPADFVALLATLGIAVPEEAQVATPPNDAEVADDIRHYP